MLTCDDFPSLTTQCAAHDLGCCILLIYLLLTMVLSNQSRHAVAKGLSWSVSPANQTFMFEEFAYRIA